jgi:hypothetical protein
MDNRVQALTNLSNQICSFRGGIPPFQIRRVALNNAH